MTNKVLNFNLINTNSRSLQPKVNSLLRNFSELDLQLAIIAETWLTEGSQLELDTENLLLGQGLHAITRSREPSAAGFSHGGVAVIIKENISRPKVYKYPNPENYEVLPVITPIQGQARRMAIIAAYIPPGYSVARGRGCMQHISDLVLKVKSDIDDPLVCVAGDFNQWDVENYLADYPDLEEVLTAPTRNNRRIDRVFLNWNVSKHCCRSPLATEPDREGITSSSDHNIQLVETTIDLRQSKKWTKVTFRPYTLSGAAEFEQLLSKESWQTVLSATGSNNKQRALQRILDSATDACFPLKTSRKREDDLPWMNDVARKKIKKKKAVYRDEGKSRRWEALLADLERYLAARQEIYLQKQRDNLLTDNADKNFHKNVKSFKSHEKPKEFDIRSLRPEESKESIAEEAAEYFNRISKEFQPLSPSQIPSTYDRALPKFTCENVKSKLLSCKKPKSMVKGDIFPKLVVPCADYLAVPLSNIYNEILNTFVWPMEWKREYVTAIPKKTLPEDFSDLRNISCTNLFSKVFESFILQYALEEISLKKNQYGGIKGCSTSHLLVDLMQSIYENGEDYRCSTVVTAIDYAKAFNRLSFQHCLAAFKKKGSSTTIIRLLATFLTNRTMTLRVGDYWSVPREVTGGCPQGSILGVLLFNVTTDDLEDDFLDKDHARLGLDPLTPTDRHVIDRVDRAPELVEPVSPSSNHHPATSTPSTKPPSSLNDIEVSPVIPFNTTRSFVLEANVRNAPFGWHTPPREEKIGTQILKEKPVEVRKYIDDNLLCEKLNFGQTVVETVDDEQVKRREAPGTQNAFRSIEHNAKDKGMLVNSSKTNMICISDALNYTPVASFTDSTGNEITSGTELKVLGFSLSNRPGVALHVKETCKKLRRKYWMLRHLKKVGFNNQELVRCYQVNIVPVADYCDVVYHSSLTDEQDQALEQAQVGALRCIYGPKISGRAMRSMANVKTLRQRRIEHCDKFAQKCAASSRFSSWFPLRTGRRSARNNEHYQEHFAKTDRLRNSPLFYMRRRMNGKEGKKYGERYRIYRES